MKYKYPCNRFGEQALDQHTLTCIRCVNTFIRDATVIHDSVQAPRAQGTPCRCPSPSSTSSAGCMLCCRPSEPLVSDAVLTGIGGLVLGFVLGHFEEAAKAKPAAKKPVSSSRVIVAEWWEVWDHGNRHDKSPDSYAEEADRHLSYDSADSMKKKLQKRFKSHTFKIRHVRRFKVTA